MNINTLRQYAQILEALDSGERRTFVVLMDDDGTENALEGVAREVVGRDNLYRAEDWNDFARLRITTVQGFEVFVSLGDILEVDTAYVS